MEALRATLDTSSTKPTHFEGLLMDVGCHAIDMLDFLLGPMEAVAGHGAATGVSDYDVEDTVAMSFRQGHASGTCLWNFAAFEAADELVITGTAGKLEMGVFGPEEIRLTTRDDKGSIVKQRLSFERPQHVAQPYQATMIAELRQEPGVVCPGSVEAALRCARVMDTVLESYYHGRQREFWDPPLRRATT